MFVCLTDLHAFKKIAKEFILYTFVFSFLKLWNCWNKVVNEKHGFITLNEISREVRRARKLGLGYLHRWPTHLTRVLKADTWLRHVQSVRLPVWATATQHASKQLIPPNSSILHRLDFLQQVPRCRVSPPLLFLVCRVVKVTRAGLGC